MNDNSMAFSRFLFVRDILFLLSLFRKTIWSVRRIVLHTVGAELSIIFHNTISNNFYRLFCNTTFASMHLNIVSAQWFTSLTLLHTTLACLFWTFYLIFLLVLLTFILFELHLLNYEGVFSLFLRANHSIRNWFTDAAVLLTPSTPLWCWLFPSPKILFLNMEVATHLGRVKTLTLRNQPPPDERIIFLVPVIFRTRIPFSKCRPCRSRFIGRQRIYGDHHG